MTAQLRAAEPGTPPATYERHQPRPECACAPRPLACAGTHANRSIALHLPHFLTDWLSSYVTLFLLCAICGFPIPFPEDVVVMTVGTLVAEGKLSFWKAAVACGAGMFVRDLNAFLVARALSHWLVEQPRLRAFVGEKNIERWTHIFERRGGVGIFLVRFAVGSRVKLFFIAAALGVGVRTFIVADVLGMFIVTPLLLWLGYAFGQPLIDGLVRAMAYAGPLLTVALLVAAFLVFRMWRSHQAAARAADTTADTDAA